jgi:hypothetical protein
MADIRVRVGQENAIKVIASVSGSAGGQAVTSDNVIGGIASVTQLSVSGVSTFVGLSTFSNSVYFGGSVYYTPYIGYGYGVAYFNNFGELVSTGSTSINQSNLILSTDQLGIPTWANTIDGGLY